MKKKPHFTIKSAHGVDPLNGDPNWLTAAAALVNTDIVATGMFIQFIHVITFLAQHLF